MRGSINQTPDPIETEVLRKMVASDGLIQSFEYGRWSTSTEPMIGGRPVWGVSLRTIRVMEAKGWLARTKTHPEEWKDTRKITSEGRAAL